MHELIGSHQEEAIRAIFGNLEELQIAPTIANSGISPDDLPNQLFAGLLEGSQTSEQGKAILAFFFPNMQTHILQFDPQFPYVAFHQTADLLKFEAPGSRPKPSWITEYVKVDGVVVQRGRGVEGTKATFVRWKTITEEKKYEVKYGKNDTSQSIEMDLIKIEHTGQSFDGAPSVGMEITSDQKIVVQLAGDTKSSSEKFTRAIRSARAKASGSKADAIIRSIINPLEIVLDRAKNSVVVTYSTFDANNKGIVKSVSIEYNSVQELEDTPFVVELEREDGVITVTRHNILTDTTWSFSFLEKTFEETKAILEGEKEQWGNADERLPMELTITESPQSSKDQ